MSTEITSIFELIPKFAICGLLVSWLIWAQCFNKGDLKTQYKVENIKKILNIFVLLNFIFLSILTTLFIISTSLYQDTRGLVFIENWKNYIIVGFLLLTYIFIDTDKFTKEKLKNIIERVISLFLGLAIIFWGISIASYFTAFKYLIGNSLFIVCFLFIFIYLIVYFSSKVFSEDPKDPILSNKKSIFIFILFILILTGLIYIISPKTITTETDLNYVFDEHMQLKLHKEVNTTIERWGNIPYFKRIPIKYNDIDISGDKNNPIFNKDIRLVLHKENVISKSIISIDLKNYIKNKDEFDNGLKYLYTDFKNQEIMFEFNPSEVKDIKTISLQGFKDIYNYYDGILFHINRINHNVSKTSYTEEEIVVIIVNKKSPIKIDKKELYRYNYHNTGFSKCDLDKILGTIDNKQFSTICELNKSCTFGTTKNQDEFKIEINKENYIFLSTTNAIQFQHLNLKLHLICN